MATEKDLSRMNSIVSKNTRYFYEIDKEGNKVLRHILISSTQNILQVPADGVTIDVVPDDSVGTEQIKDGGVQMADLSPDAIEAMKNQFITDVMDAEVAYGSGQFTVRQLLTEMAKLVDKTVVTV